MALSKKPACAARLRQGRVSASSAPNGSSSSSIFGFIKKSAGDADALLHAAGDFMRIFVHGMLHVHHGHQAATGGQRTCGANEIATVDVLDRLVIPIALPVIRRSDKKRRRTRAEHRALPTWTPLSTLMPPQPPRPGLLPLQQGMCQMLQTPPECGCWLRLQGFRAGSR